MRGNKGVLFLETREVGRNQLYPKEKNVNRTMGKADCLPESRKEGRGLGRGGKSIRGL